MDLLKGRLQDELFEKKKKRFRVHLSVAVTIVRVCIVWRLITFCIDGGALYRALELLELLSCSLYGHTK
jgi:hypothetical protein